MVSFSTFNSLFLLAIPVVAGFASLLGVVMVAVAFTLLAMALESFHISTWILGGLTLGWSTALGRAGISGVVSARLRAGRLREAEAKAAPPLRGLARRRALETVEAWLRPPLDVPQALALDEVSVSFGGLRALSDVSITVRPGEWVGLIGPNGAGKSTLFDVAGGIGLSPEGRRVLPTLTVEDNLVAGAYGLPDPVVREQFAAVHSLFPILAERRSQRAGSLSGGEQQMLAIGRVLMRRPRLLLVDEPSIGLAPVVVDQLYHALRALCTGGMAVLVAEQYQRFEDRWSDRWIVLERGTVVASGTREDAHVLFE